MIRPAEEHQFFRGDDASFGGAQTHSQGLDHCLKSSFSLQAFFETAQNADVIHVAKIMRKIRHGRVDVAQYQFGQPRGKWAADWQAALNGSKNVEQPSLKLIGQGKSFDLGLDSVLGNGVETVLQVGAQGHHS